MTKTEIRYSGTEIRTAFFKYDGIPMYIKWDTRCHAVYVNGELHNIGDFTNERATFPEFYEFVKEVYNNPELY